LRVFLHKFEFGVFVYPFIAIKPKKIFSYRFKIAGMSIEALAMNI